MAEPSPPGVLADDGEPERAVERDHLVGAVGGDGGVVDGGDGDGPMVGERPRPDGYGRAMAESGSATGDAAGEVGARRHAGHPVRRARRDRLAGGRHRRRPAPPRAVHDVRAADAAVARAAGRATATPAAIVVCGGAMGGLLGPAEGLYHRLGVEWAERGVQVLRVGYRRAGDLEPCSLDVAAAVQLAVGAGAERVVVMGHSFGGAVAVRVGVGLDPLVAGVVTFATQSAGCEIAGALHGKPLLLFHGDRDEILPVEASEMVRMIAGSGELVRLPGDGHLLAKSGDIDVGAARGVAARDLRRARRERTRRRPARRAAVPLPAPPARPAAGCGVERHRRRPARHGRAGHRTRRRGVGPARARRTRRHDGCARAGVDAARRAARLPPRGHQGRRRRHGPVLRRRRGEADVRRLQAAAGSRHRAARRAPRRRRPHARDRRRRRPSRATCRAG